MNTQLVGLGGYLCLAFHGRVVKDSQLAPTFAQQVALVEIAERGWGGYRFLAEYASRHGADMLALMEPARGLVEEAEERLRPSDWWDRVAKTYVTVGVLTDLWIEIATDAGDEWLINDELARAWGHPRWAQDLIAAGVAEDATLGPRLSLWGRRVLGDAIALARRALAAYPQLAAVAAREEDEIIGTLTGAHSQRMKAAGLKG